jgi:hypothetical protein
LRISERSTTRIGPDIALGLHAAFAARCYEVRNTAGGLVLPGLQSDPPSLFGRPVYIDGYLPAPAANAKSIAFGDFGLEGSVMSSEC